MREKFITNFFGKDKEELDIVDIKNYFQVRQEESSTIEFKRGDVEINDVYKEVTAFLNTEGGLLIIGSPTESKEKNGKKEIKYCQGEITYSKFLSKDWLYQKLFSNITPSPTEIFIKEFDIPQSNNPPHQSNSDGRYYIRLDSEAKPAPHGLVQALFDKRRKPKLYAKVDREQIDINKDNLYVSIYNDSNIPADKVSFIIDIYNVKETDDRLNFKEVKDITLGKRLSLSQKANQVLVSVVSLSIDFMATHLNQKYLVVVSYWSKKTDFDCMYFEINPKENQILSNHWLNEDANLLDAIRKIQS